MTKIAICDDDPQCLARIQDLILLQGECPLPELRTFSRTSDLTSAIMEDGYLPDIAVLDIVMPGDSGIELAKQLNLICPSCAIIFFSSHLSLATEVYETRHSYFVLKSQAEEKIGSALKKALEDQSSREHICIRCNGREQLLPVSEVLFMERKLKKTLLVQVSGNEHLVSAKPDELLCNGCSTCANVCPYGAITYEEKEVNDHGIRETRRLAMVNSALCQGCGACTVACPSGAMDLQGFSNRQIIAEVDAICR